MLNDAQNPRGLAIAIVLAGNVVKLRRLAGGLNVFRGFFQFLRHLR